MANDEGGLINFGVGVTNLEEGGSNLKEGVDKKNRDVFN